MKSIFLDHTDVRAEPRSGGRGPSGHTAGWARLVGLCSAAAVLSACGVLGGGAAPTAVPALPTEVPATSAPSAVAKPAATPTAAPAPTTPPATSVPAADAGTTVWVGNTDGQGVYVRTTPVMADRARPYPDGTPLTVVGEDVDGDGQHWKHIETPDGVEGYVPSRYTVDTPP